MNDWQELVSANAPTEPVYPDCAITDLSQFGLIRVSGEDARTFLQGQLTNDTQRITRELAQISSYCSPKGRMLSSFLAFQRDDDVYLFLPRERVPAILKRLRMFVLRAQATLTDVSDELPMFGYSGECAAASLASAPEEDWGTKTDNGVTTIRLPGDRPRFVVLAEPEQLSGLWSSAAENAVQTGPEFWSLMDIRAGVPGVYEETVEAFVPQMANLQLIGGVSFTKGCYTGQEIVARMQYLGKLKRRMYRVNIDTATVPPRGTELYSPSSESGQGAGRIVDAAFGPDGKVEALAVLQISGAEANDILLGDENGARLEVIALPYDFAED